MTSVALNSGKSTVPTRCKRALTHLRMAAARSRVASRLSLLLRNQFAHIVGQSLFQGFDPRENGEAWLCDVVLPQTHTFIDVGANFGNWAAPFLGLPVPNQRRAFLFEPAEFAVARLSERFGGMAGVEIIRAAVADVSGETTFFERPNGSEQSSLTPCDAQSGVRPRTVRVTKIDEEMESRGVEHVDVMKIDTEGYDLHVLRGSTRMLADHRVGVIQFEYNSPWSAAGSTLAGARNLLARYGYPTYLLRRTGLFEMDFDRYGEFFSYANFVAFSDDWASLLKPFVRGKI